MPVYYPPQAGGAAGTISAGTTNASLGEVVFSNSNGVTFGLDGLTVTATVATNYLTTQSGQAFSAVGGSSAFQTLSFSNANGISFSNNAGQVQASYTVPTQTAQTQSNLAGVYDGANSVSTGTLRFTNANGVTFTINGQTLSASVVTTYLTSQSTQFMALTLGGNTAGTTTFHATNNASLFLNGGNNVTLSGNGSTVTISAANQTNQQMTAFAASNTTQSSSGTFNASSIIFAGAGIASVGVTNGSVLISVPAGGGGGDGVNIIAAGTRTATTAGTVLFSNANGVTFGLDAVNGSIMTASVAAAGGGGFTAQGCQPYDDFVQVVGQVGQGTLQLDPQILPNVSFDRLMFLVQNTNSSNSSGSHTLRFSVGLYTRNASTLSLYTSFAGSTALTHSGTAGSYSLYSGQRGLAITFGATSIPADRYWLAFVSSTSSGGTNGTYSNYMVSNLNSNYTGLFGVAANATMQPKLGQGFYSATTTALPNSIHFSQIQGTASAAKRFPVIGFGSGTV